MATPKENLLRRAHHALSAQNYRATTFDSPAKQVKLNHLRFLGRRQALVLSR